MDEKDYELLITLYETKNITRAAGKLFMTQPAITKRIQKMEEELQCSLLLRSKKGVMFTPSGERIIPYAAQILSNTRLLREQAVSSQEVICGSLNIGASVNFAHYQLPALLKEYTHRYPLVDIRIVTGQSRDLYHMLKRDEISIAILRGEYSWDDGMELIATEPMCLVCSQENKGRPLGDYPYIGRSTDAVLTAKLRRWRDANGLSGLVTKLYINDIDTCKEMVKNGLGWCILPKICLNGFDGYMEELSLDNGEPFVRNTYVLYRRPYDTLPQVKLFLNHLKAPQG